MPMPSDSTVRRLWTDAFLAVVALVCIGLAALARPQLAALRPQHTEDAELTLFPSGRFLREASLGHRQLVADFAWLTAVQYYGKHRLSDRSYPLAEHLFTVLTECDPSFENAYFFGGLILAEAGDLESAERLLRRGAELHPDSWRLNFELGFFYYILKQDWSAAGRAFARAARLSGAPDYVVRFAAASYERANDPRTAALLWETVARTSGNDEIRRLARDRLAALRESCGHACGRAAARRPAESGR